MTFAVEKLLLTDAQGTTQWRDAPAPLYCGDVEGTDARSALAAVAARDGANAVGITAALRDGTALTVLRRGRQLYALRAVPRGDAGEA